MSLTKKYGFTNEQLAKLFKYSSTASFENSSIRKDMQVAVETIIQRVEKQIVDGIIGATNKKK
jgi:hypothetical protein